MRGYATIAAIIVGALLFAAGTFGQSGGRGGSSPGKPNQRPAATPTPTPDQDNPTAADGEPITISTQIVSLPVRVMDRRGRFVSGLTKDDFRVSEDGVDQEIAMFSNESQPFTVALMLDVSYSAKFKINEIQMAAIEFVEQLRPDDKVMIVSFDGEVHILTEPTSDRRELKKAILTTRIDTGTSLYDAVDIVMNRYLRKIDGRKAIILFSDGVDTTSSRVTDLTNLADALELDALVYSIRYDTFSDVQAMKNTTVTRPPPPIAVPTTTNGGRLPSILQSVGRPSEQGTTPEEYRRAEEYLTQLATRTGGRSLQATSITNLAEAYRNIASELREFYSLAYYPTVERIPGKRTNVKVRVAQQGLVVRTRESFLKREKR